MQNHDTTYRGRGKKSKKKNYQNIRAMNSDEQLVCVLKIIEAGAAVEL